VRQHVYLGASAGLLECENLQMIGGDRLSFLSRPLAGQGCNAILCQAISAKALSCKANLFVHDIDYTVAGFETLGLMACALPIPRDPVMQALSILTAARMP
jgi:hypothetical protein